MPLALQSILINDHKGTREPLTNLRSTFAQVSYPEKKKYVSCISTVLLGRVILRMDAFMRVLLVGGHGIDIDWLSSVRWESSPL